ncbi:RNA-binding protein [Candidatus Woesearchaeota archaeon]|nr:RNA-binding protein [Candidatus Woesearchaeota archaeon]
MDNEQLCISCKKNITNMAGVVVFNCPSCKEKIIRCGNCRAIGAKYSCKCGFTGPN